MCRHIFLICLAFFELCACPECIFFLRVFVRSIWIFAFLSLVLQIYGWLNPISLYRQTDPPPASFKSPFVPCSLPSAVDWTGGVATAIRRFFKTASRPYTSSGFDSALLFCFLQLKNSLSCHSLNLAFTFTSTKAPYSVIVFHLASGISAALLLSEARSVIAISSQDDTV